MKKIIIGGLLAGLVIMAMSMIFGALSSEMYKMSPRILWKPMDGTWFYKMVAFDLISGLALAWAFSIIKTAVPGTGLIKGACFGLLVFIVGPLLGLTMTYLTMAVRTKLIAVWLINQLLNNVFSGMIFEIIEEKIS